MTSRYLAIDLGAESGRAVLAELHNHAIAITELHRFPNGPVQLPNGLYWDALRLFGEICEGIRRADRAATALDGIGIDAWGVDFGLFGPDGALLDNPRHYRDPRTRDIPKEVFKIIASAEIFRQTGVQFLNINSLYQLYATYRNSPHILEAVSKLLFIPDVFNYFLTGTFASERTIASTSQFYNPITKTFATDMLRRLGIHAGFLGCLCEPGTELGPILPYAAECCALNHDVMVYATASHDTASAVASVPASGDCNWCYISSGTWSLMGVEIDDPIINDASFQANFTNEVGISGKIRFLKNIPGLWILQECRRAWAREGQEYSYDELMERAEAAKALDSLLDLDEFTSPGDYPNQIREYCRKTGQEVPADDGSVVRVILQSIAARYKVVLSMLENITRKQIEVIHIVGGGSLNRLLNQLTADFTGRQVIAGPAEATAVGNALVQAMAAGEVSSLYDLRAIVRQSFALEEFTPKR